MGYIATSLSRKLLILKLAILCWFLDDRCTGCRGAAHADARSTVVGRQTVDPDSAHAVVAVDGGCDTDSWKGFILY